MNGTKREWISIGISMKWHWLQAQTNSLRTHLGLLQSPDGLALAAGMAFVADGTAGLQVVNYLPFDDKRQGPTVICYSSISTSGNVRIFLCLRLTRYSPSGGNSLNAGEGTRIRVRGASTRVTPQSLRNRGFGK